MKCDDHHRRNSTVSVLFVSGVPWVRPAVSPTTLVSARTHPLVRQDKTVHMTLKKHVKSGASREIVKQLHLKHAVLQTTSFLSACLLCKTC